MKLILACVLIIMVTFSVSSNFGFGQAATSGINMVLRGGILGGTDYPSNDTYSQTIFFNGNIKDIQTGQPIVIKIFQGNLLYRTNLILAGNITSDGAFVYETKVKGIMGQDNKIDFIYDNQTVEEMLPYAHTGIQPPPLPNVYDEAPLKQFKSGIVAKDVTCTQNMQLLIKKYDGSPACVRSETAQKLVERGWGTMVNQNLRSNLPVLSNSAKVANTNFTINYNVTGAKVTGITKNPKGGLISISLQAQSDGSLSMEIPRNLYPVIPQGFHICDNFLIQINGQNVDAQKIIKTTSTYMITGIPFFQKDKEIDVYDTCY